MIEVLKVEEIIPNSVYTVYNFEVEDNHNYFVGIDKVLVHNMGSPCKNACGERVMGD